MQTNVKPRIRPEGLLTERSHAGLRNECRAATRKRDAMGERALTWLARDPVHTQIHEAVERLCTARAKVVLALRLDYARKDSARARTSLNSASVDSRPHAFSEHDAEQ